jgi:hypothetical protein
VEELNVLKKQLQPQQPFEATQPIPPPSVPLPLPSPNPPPSNEPSEDKFEGWLTKRGFVVPNWKRRYFYLEQTLIYYYKRPVCFFIFFLSFWMTER